MELFELLFMFIYFLGRKLCKFSVLLAPNIMISPTIHAMHMPSGVILNPNILRDNRFKLNIYYFVLCTYFNRFLFYHIMHSII